MQNSPLYETQLDLELRAVELGIKRYREHVQHSALHDVAPGVSLLRKIILPLSEKIHEFAKPGRGGGRLGKTKTYLRMLHSDQIAYLAGRTLLSCVAAQLTLTKMATSVASAVQAQIEYERMRKEQPRLVKKVDGQVAGESTYHKKKTFRSLRRKTGIPDLEWDAEMKLNVGVKLIDLFISTTGLVKRTLRTTNKGTVYHIEPTEELLRWLEEAHARNELLAPYYLPTVIPPKPWTSTENGGYYSHKLRIIRSHRHKQLVKEVSEADPDLSRVYAAINALQNTAWRINSGVYEVFKVVWEEGGGIAGLPTRELRPFPPTPWSTDEEFSRLKVENPEVVRAWKKQASEIHDQRKRDVSHRISAVQKLFVAETFLKYSELYFPHSIDWRGRAYPVPNVINPQSDDLGKALIHFAEAKPLSTKEARDWFHIHGANCYGVDKVSFSERIQWVKDNKENIVRSAQNPLDCYEFWTEADSPWKFLAFCFEFKQFVETPETFVSRLPIAMDGSCNGLQHLSMLLRDQKGGASVNLVAADKPNDIYQEVADIVNRYVEEDAAAGVQGADVWIGKVDRKLVKRGVMTTPYGVTSFGLKDQLFDEVRKRNEDPTNKYLDLDDLFTPCKYMGETLGKAIHDANPASTEAMVWFQNVARVFSDVHTPMQWTTPVGWYALQAYRKHTNRNIHTMMGGIRIRLKLLSDGNQLDKARMRNGASPNIIHSLDAAHLMLTVNRCTGEGIRAFAMVHDSFATHAADAPRLAQVLREEFCRMYQGDILADLREQFLAQLPEEKREEVPSLPNQGTLSWDSPNESAYFFA